ALGLDRPQAATHRGPAICHVDVDAHDFRDLAGAGSSLSKSDELRIVVPTGWALLLPDAPDPQAFAHGRDADAVGLGDAGDGLAGLIALDDVGPPVFLHPRPFGVALFVAAFQSKPVDAAVDGVVTAPDL